MSDRLQYEQRNFSAVETGKEIRKALREAFPGVKFSLRGSRGTGYGWFSLSWTDGPTTWQADAVTNGFRSSYFDGMDDSTHQIPPTLYALDDGTFYEPRYSCHGVNSSREYSTAAATWARSYIEAHGGAEIFCPDYPDAELHHSTWRVLQSVDLTGVDIANVPLVETDPMWKSSARHLATTYCIETGNRYDGGGYVGTHRATVSA